MILWLIIMIFPQIFAGMFVLLIPLIYIMPHMISDSTTGVYMAEPIADITAVIFTSVLFTFQFKKALAEIQN